MLLVQIGSMPHELTLKNISLLASEVLPHLRGIWNDEGWVNHWWPRGAARGHAGAHGSRRGLMAPAARTVAVWQDQVHMRVLSKGEGPAVVFFHGPWGLAWDPFLDELARSFTVHAPEHPGTSPGRPDDIYHLDGVWDLVLCYDELLDALGLSGATLRGSLLRRHGRLRGGGGPSRPVSAAWCSSTRSASGARTRRFPTGCSCLTGTSPATSFATPTARPPGGCSRPRRIPEARVMARVGLQWAMGATGKFLWPIPDKGLKKRIHRIQAPTLVVWGKEDRIVPPVYAEEFARRIPGAAVEIVDQAGHAPHLEQPEAVARLVRDFLAR